MSSTVKESYFWKQVKAGLEDVETDLCRIENVAGTGIFDVNACRRGREAWIELKVFHGRKIYFRNSQRSWAVRRSKVGGRALVLVRNDDVLFLHSAIAIVNAKSTPGNDGKSFSVDASDLPAPLFTCAKPFKWSALREAIFESP